jgi:hypothetical protein
MIQFPRRSVTRFFIPLIDVLILLFCIFLLMPMVKPKGAGAALEELSERLRFAEDEAARLRDQGGTVPPDLLEQIKKLQEERIKALQQYLAVRVLEIDGTTGKLYRNAPTRSEIGDEAAAQRVVDDDRRDLEAGKELYYLILYPRDPSSPYPTRGQREAFDHWFQNVAHGYDIPGIGPGTQGGGTP